MHVRERSRLYVDTIVLSRSWDGLPTTASGALEVQRVSRSQDSSKRMDAPTYLLVAHSIRWIIEPPPGMIAPSTGNVWSLPRRPIRHENHTAGRRA